MKFKVGDVVKNIRISDGNTNCLNKIGKIIYIHKKDYWYTVEFFEPVDDVHSGRGRGKKGYCWDFYKDEIKLYREPILKLFLKEKQNEL